MTDQHMIETCSCGASIDIRHNSASMSPSREFLNEWRVEHRHVEPAVLEEVTLDRPFSAEEKARLFRAAAKGMVDMSTARNVVDFNSYAETILETGGSVEVGGLRISRLGDEPEPSSRVVDELVTAIVHTAEYLQPLVLPAMSGYSWYEALKRYAPREARNFRERYVQARLEAGDTGPVPE